MTRALVLSGGGPVGIAWQTGLVAGLAAEGVFVGEADHVVGTSAGSAVGAQTALGRDPHEQVERYRRARAARAPGSAGNSGIGTRMQALMDVMAETAASQASPVTSRAAIGRFALDAETGPEEDFVNTFRHLRGETWPRGYACTAVDALSGEFVVWDAAQGVELDRAVASSCAVPGVFPPITLNGRRYIDGGMRSVTNADLAKGHDVVLVVSLLSGRPGTAPGMERLLRRTEDELAMLRDAGSTVEVVVPDEDAARAIGIDLMDASGAFTAVELGFDQGRRAADEVGAVWAA